MKNSYRTIGYLVLALSSAALMVLISIWILNDLWSDKLPTIDSLNQRLASAQASSKTSAAVSRTIKDSQDERSRLDLYFITKDTTQNFIEELDSTASQSNVTMAITSLSVSKDGSPASPSFLKFDLRADGGFADVYHFLTAIESLPYKVRIEAVKVARLGGDDTITRKNGKRFVPWYTEITVDLMSYIDK